MDRVLSLHDQLCTALICFLILLAGELDRWRRRVRRRGMALRASIRKLWRAYLRWRGLVMPVSPFRRRRAANRIPEQLEDDIVRLHVGWPSLGAGRLRHVVTRVLGVTLARETIRAVLKRNEGMIAALERQKRRSPKRIVVTEPRVLWGLDLTLVWVLGFLPVWILGIVDYHGSRLVALEPLWWPSTAEVLRVVERAFHDDGEPRRVITDRGSVFQSAAFGDALLRRNVEHTMTKPHHPWTNGKIERLFRTFKDTVREHFWPISSRRQWRMVCDDFKVFYNECRPHQSFGGLTPAEVHAGRRCGAGRAVPTTFFGGRMRWWRFS